MTNAMPFQRRQRAALRRAVVRQLGWGLTIASREMRDWRARAEAIPDEPLRADAIQALEGKRGHIDGAALFWTLADERDVGLIRVLVAYELIFDYADSVSERGAEVGLHNGRQIFSALHDALDPDRPLGDWYRHHPWKDDGGFLRELVVTCREGCRRLPGFEAVRPLVAREAARTSVLAVNHELGEERRDDGLRRWAAEEFPENLGLHWWELTAAASQSIVTFALLALATDPRASRERAEAVYEAYFPWFAYGVTMFDAYVDAAEDAARGAHSYVAHYPDHELAVLRLCLGVERAAARLLELPDGERHAVLLGCMVAMYLSKNSAWTPELRAASWRICRSGGTLTTILLPILRAWRICNRQTART